MSRPVNTPILRMLTGALFISFSGIWVAWAGVPPMTSAFYRVFFGALFLAACCLPRREFQRIPPAAAGLTALCGFFFAADLYCWHRSISYVGPGLATILGNFQVFLLTLFGWLVLGERLRARFVISLPLAFVGLLLIIELGWRDPPPGALPGLAFGLATAICYAAFLLLLRRLQATRQSVSFFSTLMLVSAASAIFLALGALFTGSSFAIPGPASLACLIGLGLFSQTIGWSLITNSLPHLPPSVAGLLLLLQPSLSFVWDVLLLDRPTSTLNWAGVMLALAAIYLGMTTGSRRS